MISLLWSLRRASEGQPALAGGVGQGRDAAVVLVAARSKTTDSMPAAFARSATSSPTFLALAVLSPSRERRSASMVEADASVLPDRSSTTWTLMCFATG